MGKQPRVLSLRGNHPELCKTFPEAPTVTGVAGRRQRPRNARPLAKCEAVGLPSKFRIDPAGQYRATRAPLLRDAVSYTMKRQAGGEKEPVGHRLRRPDRHLDALPLSDDMEPHPHRPRGDIPVLPISATETAVTTKWLVHKDAVEGCRLYGRRPHPCVGGNQ